MRNTKSIKTPPIIEASTVRVVFCPLNEQIGCTNTRNKGNNKTNTSIINQPKKKQAL